MNTVASKAGGMISTTEKTFGSDGASSGDVCLHSCGDDQIAHNYEIFNAHGDKKATPLQTERNAALAQAAALLRKIDCKASKHMAVNVLQFFLFEKRR